MPVTPFGDAAARWARRLPPDLSVIVADATKSDEALAHAADRRRTGESFYAAVLLQEASSAAAARFGGEILRRSSDLEQRRVAFEALAGGTPFNGDDFAGRPPDANARVALRHLVALADAMLVRSWTEYERTVRLLDERRPFVELARTTDPFIEKYSGRPCGDHIVIWAPDMPADTIGVLIFALEELLRPVTAVCHGTLPDVHATFVSPEQGFAALDQACILIDASTEDPATAVGLARTGLPLLTASTSGAHEFVDGTIVYEPHRWDTVLRGAICALGGNPVCIRRFASDAPCGTSLSAAAPISVDEPPLVTMIVPTFNRRELIRECLVRLAQQRYPNLEALIVNDGGIPVDDVAAEFPFSMVLNNERNVGWVESVNRALRVARGDYVGCVADDDPLYPDHIVRIIYALSRTGAAIAHGNVLERFLEPAPTGTGFYTRGFGSVYRGFLDRTAMLANAAFPFLTLLARKDVFAAIGPIDTTLPMQSEYEFLLRMTAKYDAIRVDCILAEQHHFSGSASLTERNRMENVRCFEEIYRRYPSSGRGSVEEARERVLEWYRWAAQPNAEVWEIRTRLLEPIPYVSR